MGDKATIILGPVIGGLSHERVNLWARADGPSTLQAWLASKKDLSDAKRKGKTVLTEATGFAGIITIEKLKPDSTYYFALTLDPKLRPAKKAFKSFKTFPAPHQPRSFRFAFGSCFRPEEKGAGRAFQHLNENAGKLSFLILEGDQIYADEFKYNGLGHIALTLGDYRAVYRKTWENGPLRELMSHTPAFMTLDDHEVDNDWHWHDSEYKQPDIPFYTKATRWFQKREPEERRLTLERTRAALQAYHEHQALHAPPLLLQDGTQAYAFEYGTCAFFVMDTRTHRVRSRQGLSMLGETQLLALTSWLQKVKNEYPVKFIVTSTSLLSHVYFDIFNDRWSGFKIERDRLLRYLSAEGIEGVYFLAGDLHSAHAISAQVYDKGGKPVTVWEFCASPFEQSPNTLALLLDHPAISPVLQKQKRYFAIAEINYGLVEVEFDQMGQPVVRFEAVYNERGEWKSKTVMASQTATT